MRKDITIEDFNHVENATDRLFDEHVIDGDNAEFNKAKPSLFFVAIFLSIVLLIVIYALTPISRVRKISVSNNWYLSADYITDISGVSTDSFFYMMVPQSIQEKVEEDPFIESASIQLKQNNVVYIEVKEKQPIGYRYDGDEPEILFTDGTTAALTSEYMDSIAMIPYISGFTEEEQTHLLTHAFAGVSQDMIEQISSISQYSLSYDDEAIEIRMRDGGIFFGSYYSLDLLNSYYEISSLMTNKDYCIYAYEGANVASARACPWDAAPTTHDYWTDENGNYIYNKWGDRAVMHYYRDDNGGYYLDENGYWILIPIDEDGNDAKDPDFLENYLNGYYATGKLVIPEETEEDETGEEAVTDETTDDTEETVTETVEEQEQTVETVENAENNDG